MKSEKIKNIIYDFVIIICIVLFAIGIAPKVLQNDTFYTIKIGEYIYQNGISNLTEDMYSWHNLPYTYPHWLYDFSMFLIYNSFGHLGIYISTIIFTAIMGMVVYLTCTRLSRNRVVSSIITIGVMYLMKPYIAARAQLVTFILFVLTLYSIEMFLSSHKKRYAIYLIIIPLLIANLHCAVFPFYFVLYLPYIAEFLWVSLVDTDLDQRLLYVFNRILKKITKKEKFDETAEKIKFNISERIRKRKILREEPYKIKVKKDKWIFILLIIMIIAMGTGLINPAGNGAYTYLYKTYQGNTTGSINEHLPLTLIENREYLFAIILFLSLLIFTDTKIKLADLFMLLGLTYLSFKSRRQVSMFAILCSPILAKMISAMFEKYDITLCKKIRNFSVSICGFVIVVSLFVIVSVKMVKPTMRAEYVSKSSYPVEASTWMLENLDVQNIKIYNEYNYGSYLLFRGIPVFIDSRCDLYTPEFNENKEEEIEGRDIFSDAINIASIGVDYKKKFKEYGVTHTILYENSKLAMILENDSDYKLIYNEGNFKIFERNTQE
ncbi:MAG: hypothetical protein HFJ46_01425 [Clostridia bacterium]|nr:hypothetical protein [Clostridia bacterium]